MHPFGVPLLRREPGANGTDKIYFGGVPWLREVATRFPDDVVFAAIQTRADVENPPAPLPALDVSNVLPIRLVVGPDRSP
jgi:hypothetical protein